MDNLRIETLKNRLRNYVGRLVGNNSNWRSHPVHEVLQKFRRFEQSAFLCGGAARDILVSEGRMIPRDLDIVIGCVSSTEQILSVFGDCGKKRMTRFGGLSVRVNDWTIDTWPLSATWALREKRIEGNRIADFPKTTFLDIEAVAVQLFSRRGHKRRIYSKGFFEAILGRAIEINLEDNPYPPICIVKALVTAHKFGFGIGPRLASYIAHHLNEIEIEELVQVQKDRYEVVLLSADTISLYIKTIKDHIRVSEGHITILPRAQTAAGFHTWTSDYRFEDKGGYLFSAT